MAAGFGMEEEDVMIKYTQVNILKSLLAFKNKEFYFALTNDWSTMQTVKTGKYLS